MYYYLVKFIDNKGMRKQFLAKNFKGILHLCYIHQKAGTMNLVIPPLVYCKNKQGLLTEKFGIVKYDAENKKFMVIRKEDLNK